MNRTGGLSGPEVQRRNLLNSLLMGTGGHGHGDNLIGNRGGERDEWLNAKAVRVVKDRED
ncbi:hypothetical protein R3Q06_18675 [Rhodococcus erythropolis]|nr:hypothetical protein [Rhodococcus erythropolis]